MLLGKTRRKKANKKPRDQEIRGFFEWGAGQCPTFTGNTTNYHRR